MHSNVYDVHWNVTLQDEKTGTSHMLVQFVLSKRQQVINLKYYILFP